MTKPLTKIWTCPTCNIGFKGSEVREMLKAGRRCPAGHFHSYYELGRHEQGKPIRVQRNVVKLDRPAAGKRAGYVERGTDRAELLALLWVAAYEKIIDQLPASTSRLLVEGAMAQAYRVSQQVLQGKTAERKVA